MTIGHKKTQRGIAKQTWMSWKQIKQPIKMKLSVCVMKTRSYDRNSKPSDDVNSRTSSGSSTRS